MIQYPNVIAFFSDIHFFNYYWCDKNRVSLEIIK